MKNPRRIQYRAEQHTPNGGIDAEVRRNTRQRYRECDRLRKRHQRQGQAYHQMIVGFRPVLSQHIFVFEYGCQGLHCA